MTLRGKLIVLRDKAGSSQMELANQLDVSRQAVSRWESGVTTPSMDKLKALAKIYDVSLDWLCNDESELLETSRVEAEGEETADTNKNADSYIERPIRKRAKWIGVAIGVIIVAVLLTVLLIRKNAEFQKEKHQVDDLTSDDIGETPESEFDFDW
jgi:transcriptional regulator with XRE-family HTH domain